MKAQITITGQMNGNYAIMSELPNYEEMKRSMFGSFVVQFATMKEAKKSLRDCYKFLKRDTECPIRISKCNTSLIFDASRAELTKYEK